MLKVAKEQMTVVPSILHMINSALVSIAANELQLGEKLTTMQKEMNENLEKANQALRLSNI
jgi:hypothetical protein